MVCSPLQNGLKKWSKKWSKNSPVHILPYARKISLVITYCIHKGKREATDGTQVDSKGTGITQQ